MLIALISGIWHLMGRRQRYAQALAPECMLCESGHVQDRDDGYHCLACGFDTDRQDDPERSATLDVCLALRNARADFALAMQLATEGGAHHRDAADLVS